MFVGQRSVGGFRDGLLRLGMRGVLDVCHGLFGLLALLDQDEWKPVLNGRRKSDGQGL
jgi:hypothetical protein